MADEETVITLKRPSLHAEVIEALRNMILDGVLPPGSRVPELDLCGKLGISRTPLREALKVLAAEGLVELQQHRGAHISEIGLQETAELFELLEAIEVRSAELAVERASDADIATVMQRHRDMIEEREAHHRRSYFDANQEVHRLIVAAAGNKAIGAVHLQVTRQIARVRYAVTFDETAWQESALEHEAIVKAFIARDRPALVEAVRIHNRKTAERTLATLGAEMESRKTLRAGS